MAKDYENIAYDKEISAPKGKVGELASKLLSLILELQPEQTREQVRNHLAKVDIEGFTFVIYIHKGNEKGTVAMTLGTSRPELLMRYCETLY